MSLRIRFIFVVSLLILSIGATVVATRATLGALQNVHQREILKRHEDLSLIQPWMTIPYISHIYRVPETAFYQPLRLQNNVIIQHSTLQVIASRQKQPVEKVIHAIQTTITHYRKSHPSHSSRSHKPLSPPKIKKGEQH